MKKPSILLADDDRNFREALQEFLQPEFDIVGSVGDGEALLEAAKALNPDIIIADIAMPLLDGLHAVRRLKATQPHARVIFLTVHEDPAFVTEAEKSGAVGYVLKRSASSELVPLIRRALAGNGSFRSAA